MLTGYEHVNVNRDLYIQVNDVHQLYVADCGNPKGVPVVFLHGGPGGHTGKACLQFFNPEKYRVILFDQRGCGKSHPFLSTEKNTPFDSVHDMEVIRQYFDFSSWVVFGGSYGSSLALTYAIIHPERVKHLVLRGIFLGRKVDVDWLYRGGAGYFYPEQYESFRSFVSEYEDPVVGYHEALIGDDEERRDEAYKRWAKWEDSLLTLFPKFPDPTTLSDEERSISLMENHYFYHKMFFESDNYLLEQADRYADIPMDIVQGRYDVICPPFGAHALAKACPKARLHLIEASCHSPYEPAMKDQLIRIMDNLGN